MRFRFLALPVAAVLLAAGCTPGNGTPTPTPTPSVSSVTSPSPTPTPTPTPSNKDALYAEAERILLRSFELRDQYELRGDYSEFPPELEELLADPYLGWARDLFEDGKAQGLHAPEGAVPITKLAHAPGLVRDGSEVALRVCVDNREIPQLNSAGEVVSHGQLTVQTAYFKHFDGRLKLFTGSFEVVTECGFE